MTYLAACIENTAAGPRRMSVRLETLSLAHAVAALIGLKSSPDIIAVELIGRVALPAGRARR